MAYIRGMKGLHLTADLYRCRCDAAWLTDADRLGAWCLEAVQAVVEWVHRWHLNKN